MGRRPRVFRCRSPKCESGCCLQVCTGLGQNPTGTKFRGYIHSTSRGHPRSLHPHYLSVYASNRDFEYLLIRSLQHSIPGAWLALTRTGFTPASQSDLASPHVHVMVPHVLGLADQSTMQLSVDRKRGLYDRPSHSQRASQRWAFVSL